MQRRTIAIISVLLLFVAATPAVTGDVKKPDNIPHRGSGR